ncbi:hypothetical protein [Klebsiella pneumoniae]
MIPALTERATDYRAIISSAGRRIDGYGNNAGREFRRSFIIVEKAPAGRSGIKLKPLSIKMRNIRTQNGVLFHAQAVAVTMVEISAGLGVIRQMSLRQSAPEVHH